jgi:hypothetical protein
MAPCPITLAHAHSSRDQTILPFWILNVSCSVGILSLKKPPHFCRINHAPLPRAFNQVGLALNVFGTVCTEC